MKKLILILFFICPFIFAMEKKPAKESPLSSNYWQKFIQDAKTAKGGEYWQDYWKDAIKFVRFENEDRLQNSYNSLLNIGLDANQIAGIYAQMRYGINRRKGKVLPPDVDKEVFDLIKRGTCDKNTRIRFYTDVSKRYEVRAAIILDPLGKISCLEAYIWD